MSLEIRSTKLKDLVIKDWHNKIEDRYDYDTMCNDEDIRNKWVSITCLCYVEKQDKVYAGVSSFDADIFYAYERATSKWLSTGYDRIADKFDAKFHRSLVQHGDSLYGAVALFHDIDNYFDASGGSIVKYDLDTGDIKKLAIPIPHSYIQSIVLDKDREIIYGQNFSPERFFSYDIKTGVSKDLGPIGSALEMAQGENIILDDYGNVWGQWGITRAWQYSPGVDGIRLFRYKPGAERIEYMKKGLPKPDGSYGNTKAEAFFNFGTGCLYASGANGSLFRIDTGTADAEYVCTPINDRKSRLASMAMGPDNKAYGVVGKDGYCQLVQFDPATEKHELLGQIIDQNGENCWQIHDIIVLPDGTIYAAENDVNHRSGYLWEIKVK